MNLKILDIRQTIFNERVVKVNLPGIDGGFQILRNHAPIIGCLENGKLIAMRSDNTTFELHIDFGVAKIENNEVIVLLDNIPTETVK